MVLRLVLESYVALACGSLETLEALEPYVALASWSLEDLDSYVALAYG